MQAYSFISPCSSNKTAGARILLFKKSILATAVAVHDVLVWMSSANAFVDFAVSKSPAALLLCPLSVRVHACTCVLCMLFTFRCWCSNCTFSIVVHIMQIQLTSLHAFCYNAPTRRRQAAKLSRKVSA
jgi:hypothetical protein